jgi:hypothetical protein
MVAHTNSDANSEKMDNGFKVFGKSADIKYAGVAQVILKNQLNEVARLWQF